MIHKSHLYATRIKWASIVVTVIALLVIVRSLPVNRLMDGLRGWIDGLGVLGPVIFGLIYVIATVAFLPGLILTVAAHQTHSMFRP